MRARARRLQRLERLGPAAETWETRCLRARLEVARLRVERDPRVERRPISPERRAERIKEMGVVEILNSRRAPATNHSTDQPELRQP
jgi:hypothetical protein